MDARLQWRLKARFSDVRIHGNVRSISMTWFGDKPKRNAAGMTVVTNFRVKWVRRANLIK